MIRSTLRHVAGFEWRYQTRSPVFWVGLALFFLLTFGSVTIDQIQIGARGNVWVNAPYAILQTMAVMSVFAVFIVVAMVANVVIRDDETGFAPIVRATSVTKASYLLGRFIGATAAAFCVLLAVPIAIAIGASMPWLDPARLGPFQPAHYLYAAFAFSLPTLLILAAGYFALATATRSMMWTYLGAVGSIVLYFTMRVLLRDPAHDTASALLDPFGVAALQQATKYWTAAERNTRLPELSGLLLANRALWAGIALAMVTVTYRRFRFATPRRAGASAPATPEAARARPAAPLAAPRRDVATRWAQLWRLTRFDVGFVVRSPAFAVLLVIGMINGGAAMWFAGTRYGIPSYPVTRLMVEALEGAFTIIPIILAVFYGGELVWRDRDRRIHEIVDATAAPAWAHLIPKILAVALVLVSASAAAVGVGVAIQAIQGGAAIDLAAYAAWFIAPTAITAVQLAALSVFVQVCVPQKYLGWGVMLIYIVASVALGAAGFEHNLYNYAGTSPVPLSDMNRMGRFWIGRAWFQGYWSAVALGLLVLAHALWRRGATVALRPRLRQLGARLRGPAGVVLAGAVLATGWTGAVIYDNTVVRTPYVTAPEREAAQARYERALLRFEDDPQPQITAVTLDVQLYPREVRAVTRGTFALHNPTAAPIAVLHVGYPDRLALDRLALAGAHLAIELPTLHHRVYLLVPALAPGERRALTFETTLAERGFPNDAPLTRIVDNGTFLDNTEITPTLGVSRDGLLRDRGKRRKYGLADEQRPPTLEDPRGRDRSVFAPIGDWVDADLTVTTDADQTPIAPGTTVSDTIAGGRRTVHTRSDAPIHHFFSIQSARYEVRRARWRDVDLAVYFHPGHDVNVDRMLRAMAASLARFSDAFSPYQFHQARILEFPSYANFAQSFANTIPYSENLGFLRRVDQPDTFDLVTYVTAHEIGHQWWAHQLIPSRQQGAELLVETLAQYSALLVVEDLYGKDQIRRFLKYELDIYLRSRGGEVLEELPLARCEGQPYIHYQKGALAMYWLKEVVGERTVNRALAGLLQRYAFQRAPYPNTLDFLAALRAEAGPAHDGLIADLFEKITLVDAKAERAVATRRPDGRYDVTLTVRAKKLYADGNGVETEAPLDEPFDVGVFSAEPGRPGFGADAVLAFDRAQLRTGPQTVTLTVDRVPAWAGVDPYLKRIDRNPDDNLVRVEVP